MLGLLRLPKGHYIDIVAPDYFVTWDAVKKDDTEEGQQEW